MVLVSYCFGDHVRPVIGSLPTLDYRLTKAIPVRFSSYNPQNRHFRLSERRSNWGAITFRELPFCTVENLFRRRLRALLAPQHRKFGAELQNSYDYIDQ